MVSRKRAAEIFQVANQNARGARQRLLKGLKDRDPLVRQVSAIELAKRWPEELTEASIRELLETLGRDEYLEPSPFDDDYVEATATEEDSGSLGQDSVVAFAHLSYGQADFVIPRLLEFWSFDCEFYELGDALLALSFPPSDRLDDFETLSGRQQRVLEALVAQPLIWQNDGTWRSTLARYGLPLTLSKMLKFLGYR